MCGQFFTIKMTQICLGGYLKSLLHVDHAVITIEAKKSEINIYFYTHKAL